jgi:hypothetical protein
MKYIILIIAAIWTVSVLIMRKQIFEEGIPSRVTTFRIILAPLLLGYEVVKWVIFGIGSTLRKN